MLAYLQEFQLLEPITLPKHTAILQLMADDYKMNTASINIKIQEGKMGEGLDSLP